jgi:DNA-directed RNA polymerase specialized sigma24 family protein
VLLTALGIVMTELIRTIAEDRPGKPEASSPRTAEHPQEAEDADVRHTGTLAMSRFWHNQNAKPHSGYATCADLCENFAKDLKPLYLLAFLLTGSHTEAEQCFVETIEGAVRAKCVFKGWERSWIKRSLIINAVRHVIPGPIENGEKRDAQRRVNVESGGCSTINAVARLASSFQRVVFVMSVLERHSTHECALLLGCAPRNVAEARIRALWQLSGVDPAFTKSAGQNAADGC